LLLLVRVRARSVDARDCLSFGVARAHTNECEKKEDFFDDDDKKKKK
jgi:hypothetical protein